MNIDKQKVSGLTCGISAIVGVGFDSSLLRWMQPPLLGGFFVSIFKRSLHGGCLGALRCAVSLTRSVNPIHLPPEFDSPDGRNTRQGASL